MPDYDADFYGWANEQAALLRAGRPADADIANIAEEIESMGRSEKRELVNRLAVLLQYLLKWKYQEARRGTSWRLTIEDQRDRLNSHLEENPSLRAKLPEALTLGYRLGRRAAQQEMGVGDDVLPPTNPWNVEQALDEGFYPE